MPIYEYTCRKCGHKFEKLIRNTSANIAPRCPVCGAEESERLVSAIGAVGTSTKADGGGSSCLPRGGG